MKKCYRCGKVGHMMSECEHKEMVCFNCGEEGHIGSKCTKPKKDPKKGKVFALAGTAVEDNLIQVSCRSCRAFEDCAGSAEREEIVC